MELVRKVIEFKTAPRVKERSKGSAGPGCLLSLTLEGRRLELVLESDGELGEMLLPQLHHAQGDDPDHCNHA